MTARRRIEIPGQDELISYDHAAAGHDGTMIDESGQLFFKPSVEAEINFYESVRQDHPKLAQVMPGFFGILSRQDNADSQDSAAPAKASAKTEAGSSKPAESQPTQEWAPGQNRSIKSQNYIVLENSSSGFTHPNILDAKLGVRLWADDAPQAKRDHFDEKYKNSTHKNFGFRIAGMRVYHADSTPPLVKEGVTPGFKVEGDYKVYDRDYGHNYVQDDNLKDALRSFVFNDAAGIDQDLGREVCRAFVRDLECIRDALENEECRMYSASCLFLFEGDGKLLRQSLAAQKEREKTQKEALASHKQAQEKEGNEEEEEVDSNDEDETPRGCTVQLIDFAHASWTPGQGPDENTLKGVRSLLRIFKELAGLPTSNE